jgi:predicted ATP-grasp superfamily ATP-dependent carboligase
LLRAARKWGAYEAASTAGAPVPDTVFLPAGRADWGLAERLGLPLVLKPDLGEGGRGLYICHDEDELRSSLDCIAATGEDHVAQAMVPHGGAFGVSIFCVQPGRVDAMFTHKRLREHPPSGGPSTLRESVRHPQAEQAARDIAAALNWQGVAMLEFREDPRDNTAKLLEINPRFWGSLPLAIAAGVDFPYLLYKAALGLPAGPAPVQKEGVRVRNLLPGDLLHFIAKRGRVGIDFFNPFHAQDELLSVRDPGPVLGRIASAAGLLFDPQLRAMLKKRQDPAPRKK